MSLDSNADELERELLADLEDQGVDHDSAVNAICATYTGQEHSVALRAAMEHVTQQKRRGTMPPLGPGVTSHEAPRVCGHEGCGKKLIRSNTSGFCSEHWYDSRRRTPADGAATPARPKRESRRKTRVSPPRKTAAKPAKVGRADWDKGVATICVTEAHLDNYWSKLSLEEKAEIFSRQLERA